MEAITSVHNDRVKQIVKLQRKASVRREMGLTVIEGSREVTRAMENGWRPSELWTCDEYSRRWKDRAGFFQKGEKPPRSDGHRSPIEEAGLSIFQCSDIVFSKISYRENPDGILAVGSLVGRKIHDLELPKNPLILVVEGVEKPGNLGALLRTADGANVDAVVICDPATDLNNPNVIRASLGTLFYLPWAETPSEEAISFLRKKGVEIVSAVPNADEVYTAVDLRGPLAIVVGAEDQGLSSRWKKEADLNLKIPMLGKNDSLNVSVSAAVLLYEAVRQRS